MLIQIYKDECIYLRLHMIKCKISSNIEKENILALIFFFWLVVNFELEIKVEHMSGILFQVGSDII